MIHRRTASTASSPSASSSRGRRGHTPTTRVRAGALTVAVIAVLTGCPTEVDWDDYEGVNLIAERPLGTEADDGTSLWYFAPGLTQGTTNTTTGETAATDFVAFEEVDSGVYERLPEGASGPVYRYEIKNLLPYGDFEGITDTELATMWTAEIAEEQEIIATVENNAVEAIHGEQSLYIETDDTSGIFWTDLEEHLLGGFPADTTFAYNIDFKIATETFSISMTNATAGSELYRWSIPRGEAAEQTVFSFPGNYSSDPAGTAEKNLILRDTSYSSDLTRLSLGGREDSAPQQILNGSFDRFTVVRGGQSHYLRLSVPYIDAGREEIVGGGSYELRFWILPDPAAGTDNRMAARGISAGLDFETNGSTGARAVPSASRTVATEIRDITASDEWTELTFTFTGAIPSRAYDAPEDTIAFDIVIEIGGSNQGPTWMDAGSILLADPQILWSP